MSLKDNKNIEELFRSGLEDFEIPVDDSMWSNISSQMNTAGAGASGSSLAGASSKMFTYLGLSGAACVVGVVATLLYTSSTTESLSNQTEVSVDKTAETTTEITNKTQDKVAPASFDDKIIVEKITEEPPALEEKDPVIKEVKKEEKKKVVVVDEKNQEYYQGSWVNNFLTPKTKPYTEPTDENSEISEDENTTALSEVVPQIEEVEQGEIIASIVAMPVGGYAPLEVSFAHHSEKGLAVWDFGDGEVVKDDNPTHIFNQYGKYTVTLTLTDKDGNEYKDYRVIEVLANSALTNIPNIFTPNGDGENDRLKLEGKNIQSYHLAILNLEGNIIYESEDIQDAWDGKDQAGMDVKEGTYVLVVSAKGIDGKKYEHSGTIALKR